MTQHGTYYGLEPWLPMLLATVVVGLVLVVIGRMASTVAARTEQYAAASKKAVPDTTLADVRRYRKMGAWCYMLVGTLLIADGIVVSSLLIREPRWAGILVLMGLVAMETLLVQRLWPAMSKGEPSAKGRGRSKW